MRALALLVLVLVPAPALAHRGHVRWGEFATTWTWDPWVTLPLALSGGLYATGVARLWRQAGIGRGVRAWQAGCFALGWALLVLALVAPLHWLGERLRVIRDSGVTILMVEHDMSLVLGLCDRIHVLNFGQVIASGTPAEIRSDPAVATAYLGSTHAEEVPA